MMLYLGRICQCGYTLCFGRSSVHLCAFSLQNLAVPQKFYCPVTLSVSLFNDLAEPVFDGVRLAGFKSMANDFFIGLATPSLFVPTVFPFSSLILWVGIVRLGSSD